MLNDDIILKFEKKGTLINIKCVAICLKASYGQDLPLNSNSRCGHFKISFKKNQLSILANQNSHSKTRKCCYKTFEFVNINGDEYEVDDYLFRGDLWS